MKPGMTMLMLDKMRQGEQQPRNEYGSTQNRRMIGYDRDYQREHTRAPSNAYGGRHMPPMDEYDETPRMGGYGNEMAYGGNRNGGREYARMGGYNEGPEARRRRDRRGRYAMGDEYEDEDEDDYRPKGRFENRTRSHYGGSYGDVYAEGMIYAPGAMNRPMGGEMSEPVDEHTARKWVQNMSGGEKFKMEQADQYRSSICPECNRAEYYVAMNAMYSDYCETAKRMNMDKPEFYAYLAKDFLMDKDAGPHKLRKYMMTIPK